MVVKGYGVTVQEKSRGINGYVGKKGRAGIGQGSKEEKEDEKKRKRMQKDTLEAKGQENK